MSRLNFWDLITSGRGGWQHPERVIVSLSIRPGDTVATPSEPTHPRLDSQTSVSGPRSP